VVWVVGGLSTVLALLGAWTLRDALGVRGQLVTAQAALQRTIDNPAALRTPEGRKAALADIDTALSSIDDARRAVQGSTALSLVAALPVVGGQRSGIVHLIDDSSSAATAGRTLLAKVDELAQRNRLEEGSVPVESLGVLQSQVESAAQALGRLPGRPSRLWGPVGDARRRFDELARSGSGRMTEAAEALGAARSFVGSAGSRQYLVALENNAEMRDQGAVLSYVVIRFTDGRLSFEGRGSILELSLASPVSTPLPPGTAEVFGPISPTQLWQSVNATADFALSGRVMADMYHQATGESIDGVIAIDVPGLAGVLRAVGPVSIDDVAEPIGSDNLARIVLHDLYEGLAPSSDTTIRLERLDEVVEAMVTRLTTGSHDAVLVGLELGDAAAGGHMRLWSTRPPEEDVFERTGLGGGPAVHLADRTFHLAVQNRTATKLDYYVKPSMRQEIYLSPTGTAIVRTTVTVDNQAPADGKPSYQLGPDQFTTNPGDYLAWVLLWGPAGSVQASGGVLESGLNLSQRIVDVAPSQRREVVFETTISDAVRDGKLQIRLVPQARLEPVVAEVSLSAEGWGAIDNPTWKGVLDRVQTLTWELDR